jgi:hypothetical protein
VPSAVATSTVPASPRGTRLVTIGSGLFDGGTEDLRRGARYRIALRGRRLQIMGPESISPRQLVLDRPLAQLDITGFNDQLLITEPGPNGPLFLVGFRGLAGTTAEECARMLVAARRRSSSRR